MHVRYQDGQSGEHTANLELSGLGIRIHYVDNGAQLKEVFWAADLLAPSVVQAGRPVFLRRQGHLANHLRFDNPDDYEKLIARYPSLNLVVGRKATNQFTKSVHTRTVTWVLGAGVLLLGLIAYLALALMGRLIINFAPNAWDERVGKLVYDQLTTQGQVSENARATAIAQQFYEAAGYGSAFKITVHVDKTDVVNAYALPGGPIIINEGLIAKAQTPDELAGVLAHELGHIENRHTFQQLARSGVVFLGVTVLTGGATGVISVLAENGQTIFGLTYSRNMETEADEFAVKQMLDAGIDPQGLGRFFALLQKEEAKDGMATPQLLRTHPASKKRREAVQELIPSDYEVDFAKEQEMKALFFALKEAVNASKTQVQVLDGLCGKALNGEALNGNDLNGNDLDGNDLD